MSKNRDRILESARLCFSQKAFEQVTIKEICVQAGVANSTFYYHFKTKEELMDFLRTNDAHPLQEELLGVIAAPDLLEQAVSACAMCATRAQRSGCTLTAQYYKRRLSSGDEEEAMRRVHLQEYETARILIRRAQEAGKIARLFTADELAKTAILLSSGVVVDWCATGGAYDLQQEVRRRLKMLFGCKEKEGENA